MKSIPLQVFSVLFSSSLLLSSAHSFSAEDDPAMFLGKATVKVAHAMAFKNIWDGPTTGPRLAPGKSIAFVAADLNDPSQQKLATILKEVAASVGWNVSTWDCYGVPARQTDSLVRAMAIKPSAIIFAGGDVKASDNAKQLGIAAERKIPVVGWHSAPTQGPVDGLYTNIGTEAKDAGQLAALLGVVESKARAGFIVLADTTTPYLAAKTQGILDAIKQCSSCSTLSVEQVAAGEKPEQIAKRIADLQKQFGTKLTDVVATNDRLFDFLTTSAAATLVGKIDFISAGYGSTAAYTRIRAQKGQLGTVAEPLTLQAWQMIDEINRALAGTKPSGFATDPYIVTSQNITFQGGQNNTFDPTDGYQFAYKSIWGR